MAASRLHRRWDWLGLFLILASVVLPCATIQSAAAADVKIGGRPLSFEPPSGYCLFDKNQPQEGRYISMTRRMAEPTEIPVWMFGECSRRKEWLDPAKSNAGLIGGLMVTKRGAVFRAAEKMTRAEFVAEMERTGAWQAIFRDLDKRFRARFPLPPISYMQIIAKDEFALYIGTTFSAAAKKGHIPTSNVSAITVINGLPLSLDLGGTNAMNDLLAQQRAHVRALIKRNEQNEMRATRAIEQPTASTTAQ